MSPIRHGPNGMTSMDANEKDEVEARNEGPNNSFLTNDMNIDSSEFDKMIATENFAPSKFKSKDEMKAAKKLVKEKKKIEKAHVQQEHKKKKQVEALLKAEVKQKRMLSAKMKREQQRLDERQKIQAKALSQAKDEQEKYLANLERQHQQLVKEKMKVRSRLTGIWVLSGNIHCIADMALPSFSSGTYSSFHTFICFNCRKLRGCRLMQ